MKKIELKLNEKNLEMELLGNHNSIERSKNLTFHISHLTFNKGITLIALIITIIVMLILVGVTVTVALNGGLFSTSKQAKTDTKKEKEKEEELSDGRVEIDDTWYDTFEDYINKNPSSNQNDEQLDYKEVAEIFDKNGKDEEAEDYDENKLHIGDFVNYDAGTWTKEEIEGIQVGEKENLVSANNSDILPNTAFQFGGFKAGDSRNGNATSNDLTYNYVKDESGEAITGWRVFDVDEESGEIKIISAGCPEDYYHLYDTNNGYISEYILSGNVNTDATSTDLENNYTKRDWSKYVNTSQHATSATVLTKAKLDEWYNKYMGQTNANTWKASTFQTINGTRYDNLINNYSYYWLSVARDSYKVSHVNPNSRNVDYNHYGAFGIRPVVSLESKVQLAKVGTKTLKDSYEEGKTYTYNVWNIK